MVVSTGQCYSHSHYHRRSDGWTVCDMRRAWWGLYSRKVVNGGRCCSIVCTTCFREQLPRCVWEAEGGQTRVRAGGRPRLPPVPAISLPPRPPPSRRRLTWTPVRGWRTDGRATYAVALTDHRRWTAHEDDAAARLFATNILQLLTLNFGRSRNIVVKISQRINRRKTLRLMP